MRIISFLPLILSGEREREKCKVDFCLVVGVGAYVFLCVCQFVQRKWGKKKIHVNALLSQCQVMYGCMFVHDISCIVILAAT